MKALLIVLIFYFSFSYANDTIYDSNISFELVFQIPYSDLELPNTFCSKNILKMTVSSVDKIALCNSIYGIIAIYSKEGVLIEKHDFDFEVKEIEFDFNNKLCVTNIDETIILRFNNKYDIDTFLYTTPESWYSVIYPNLDALEDRRLPVEYYRSDAAAESFTKFDYILNLFYDYNNKTFYSVFENLVLGLDEELQYDGNRIYYSMNINPIVSKMLYIDSFGNHFFYYNSDELYYVNLNNNISIKLNQGRNLKNPYCSFGSNQIGKKIYTVYSKDNMLNIAYTSTKY